ncbi:MAG: hypothetical protein JNM27_03450 [Leptospirales bacterium]|nr:hypothetical protein [Leptospirales bacterium]
MDFWLQRYFDEESSKARSEVAGNGTASYLESLAAELSRQSPAADLEKSLSLFHNIAGRLPPVGDRDYGALLLEGVADRTDDLEIRMLILKHALFRAQWLVDAASGSGEAMARSTHVHRLDAKVKHACQRN